MLLLADSPHEAVNKGIKMKNFLFILSILPWFVYSSNPPLVKNQTDLHRTSPTHSATLAAPAAQNLTINVPVAVHTHHASNLQTEQNFEPHNQVHASSESKNITITQHWQQLHNYMAPLTNGFKGKITHFMQRWKLYSCGALYSALFVFLVRTNYQMNSSESWAQWKKHMVLAEMQLYPQLQLMHDLLRDIQNRYMNKLNPTDSITPLSQFIMHLEQEQRQIEQYLSITSWLSTLWLTRIFPFNNDKIEQARAARERLNFINHLFISWATTQKLPDTTH
jgi:hypothetical protein